MLSAEPGALAILFVDQWYFRLQTIYYYDWMIRDFFVYMLGYSVEGKIRPAGITEWIDLGDSWQTKAQTAYNRALKACDHERADQGFLATSEWQKTFGGQFHLDWGHSLLAGVGA